MTKQQLFVLALQNLKPGAQWALSGVNYSELDWHDETQTKPTEEEIVQKVAELEYQEEVNEYQRQRAAEYPSMADQQDMQFHDAVNGTTTWKDAIQAVKDKYPKHTMNSDELERRKQQALTDLETES